MTEKLRFTTSGFLFAAAVLASAALIFIFGAFGARGNSSVTGGYLVVTVVGVFLLGRRKGDSLVITAMDAAVAVFAVATMIASFGHFDRGDFKEYALLAINSIFAYAAGRFLSEAVLSSIRIRLLQISTPLVAAACIATVPNLVGDVYAKPFVFGFFHAATVFCIAFGYMIIAYIYSGIEWRSKTSMLFFALIVTATAVFVASTVRFVLLAIAITALFSLASSIYRSVRIWRRIALALVAMMLGIVIGTFSRYAFVMNINDQISNTGVYSGSVPGQNVVKVERHDLAKGKAPAVGNVYPVDEPPSCDKTFDLNNSMAIRRALLGDAFFFLPKAGFFGFGLNSFARMSCFEGYQIHNSVLQTIVEFGWIAGVALMILVAIPFRQFLLRQEFGLNLQFLLSCLAFATLLSLIYGQISRELTLFLFLGAYAKESLRSTNADDLKTDASHCGACPPI